VSRPGGGTRRSPTIGGSDGGQRGSIRIIAGSRRSRRIQVPAGSTVRPTSGMVREAIFDSLGPLVDLVVLDLFAGTGAMGLEALSRGAAHCVFVEQDRKVAGVLRANVCDLGYEAESRVIVGDYHAALQEIVRTGERFDLLFVDPPYKMLTEAEVTLEPAIPLFMHEGGVVVLECDRASHPTLGAVPVFDRVYGDTRVTIVTTRGC
jgi:16S rRNA (guanine966-N2)-methyltransferase